MRAFSIKPSCTDFIFPNERKRFPPAGSMFCGLVCWRQIRVLVFVANQKETLNIDVIFLEKDELP